MKHRVWVTNIEWSTGRARENLPRQTLVGVDCVNAPHTHAWTTEVNQKVRSRLTLGFGEGPDSFVWQLRDTEDDPWETGELGTDADNVQVAEDDPHRDANINAAVGLVPLRIMIDEDLHKSIERELSENNWSNEGQLVRVALREFLDNQNS